MTRDWPYDGQSLKYLQIGPLRSVCSLCWGIWKRLKKHLPASLLGQYFHRNQDPETPQNVGWLPGTHGESNCRMDTGENSGTRVHSRVSGTHRSCHFPPESYPLLYWGVTDFKPVLYWRDFVCLVVCFFKNEKEHIEPLEVLGCVFWSVLVGKALATYVSDAASKWLSFLQDPLCLGVWPGLWRVIAHSDGTSEGALLFPLCLWGEGLLVGKRMPGVPLKVWSHFTDQAVFTRPGRNRPTA